MRFLTLKIVKSSRKGNSLWRID